ncbi:MAG: 50S ribosomal protein L37e [Candidatus Bathyarchaeia archaeon]
MGKGTPSMGSYGRSTLHIRCRRCGRRSYNVKKKRCAACGYGASAKIATYSWRTRKVTRAVRLL